MVGQFGGTEIMTDSIMDHTDADARHRLIDDIWPTLGMYFLEANSRRIPWTFRLAEDVEDLRAELGEMTDEMLRAILRVLTGEPPL
jgi:hypothetical protein